MTETKTSPGNALRVGLLCLATLAIAWGVNQWQLQHLQQELSDLANTKIEEFRPAVGKGLPTPVGRIGAEVVVAKPYVLFGAAIGKVSVYVEHESPEKVTAIEGYEFFYARQTDATWKQTESGRCVSEQCTVDGKRVLDAFGETL